MERLIFGVHQFRRTEFAQNREFFEQLATRPQQPMALFITCSDSRVNPNLITHTEPGELFIIRNAGNIVPPYTAAGGGEIATIEYSVEVLGIRDIVICGHSQCGAIQALLHPDSLPPLPAVQAWCGYAESTRRIVQQKYRHLPAEQLTRAATEENVLVQMNNLSTHPCIAARLASAELNVYGWYYDIGAGQVFHYDQPRGRFFELNGAACAAHPLPILAAVAE